MNIFKVKFHCKPSNIFLSEQRQVSADNELMDIKKKFTSSLIIYLGRGGAHKVRVIGSYRKLKNDYLIEIDITKIILILFLSTIIISAIWYINNKNFTFLIPFVLGLIVIRVVRLIIIKNAKSIIMGKVRE